MTKVDETPKCKLRFKGVENFLRRVAFNLGNTPSQTEVKIISCIPIDVTDLQQKIIKLEKELEDSRNEIEGANGEVQKNGKETTTDDLQNIVDGAQKPTNGSPKQISIIQTALSTCAFPKLSKPIIHTEKIDCSALNNTELCEDRSSKQRKSAVSFILSATSSKKAIHSSSRSKQRNLINNNNYSSVINEIRPKAYTKNKKNLPKKKINSQLIYYTEIDDKLWRNHGITKTQDKDANDEDNVINRYYLSNMIRKQYESMQIRDELSSMSHFTSPICKDADQKSQRLYETDICSCCHGPFQNIDDCLSKSSWYTYSALGLSENYDRNKYYDSSLYDLIPVKEKPVKNRIQFDITKRKEPKTDIKCWPEDERVKSRYQPFTANHQTIIPNRRIYTRKIHSKINGRKDNNAAISINPTKNSNKFDKQTDIKSSKSCLVDFGNFNTKPSPKLKSIKLSEKPLVKNVECLATAINHSECQTSTINPINNASENKTDETLNQIKYILQTVLAEVKTNSQVKSKEEETKKDATVQNEISQNNMQNRSNLLNSFTYSPYNINPYGPSCSKQMPSNYFCYPNVPHAVNCMQNYPLIIQGNERHLCTGCFQSSHITTHKNTATTASTNTEQFCEHRNKETKKLIQEIYKSLALGIPTKDTSQSEYDGENSIKEITCSNKPSKQNREDRVVVSELFTNKNVQMDTSKTDETCTIIESKTLKTDNTQSHLTTTNTDISNHIMDKNIYFAEGTAQQTTTSEPETERYVKPHQTEPNRKTPSTIYESSKDEDSSDIDSVETVVSVKQTQVKKKVGLFCRVLQIFNKTKKASNIKKENEAREPDTTDSDDYQTIYTHKSEIPKPVKNLNRKCRCHSKIFHSKHMHHRRRSPEKQSRIPYMEQEYRRLWNEKLMFQKQRQSSEKPFAKVSAPGIRYQHPYYQNYEARSVLIDPGILYRPQLYHQNRKSLFTNTLDEVVRNTRFVQQSNDVPYNGDAGKYGTQKNRQPGAPVNSFYGGDYQNIAPTIINDRQTKTQSDKSLVNPTNPKGLLPWFTKHKMDLRCGKQWKQLLLET